MKLTPQRETFLKANGKIVRNDGKTYKVIANTAGPLILASAEQIFPTPSSLTLIDLIGSRSKLSQTLTGLIQKGLVS
jgi:hypothetical protein